VIWQKSISIPQAYERLWIKGEFNGLALCEIMSLKYASYNKIWRTSIEQQTNMVAKKKSFDHLRSEVTAARHCKLEVLWPKHQTRSW
jgi:hypothetical protein